MADGPTGTVVAIAVFVFTVGLFHFAGGPVSGGFENEAAAGDALLNETDLEDAGILNPGPVIGELGDLLDTLLAISVQNPIASAIVATMVFAFAVVVIILAPLTGG